MTRKVEWARSALDDLIGQVEHIAADNPDAARRVAKAIRITGNDLGTFATGHPGRVAGTYEKAVRGLPYIIAYALTGDDSVVSIPRIIHTARDWQTDRWPA